MRIYEIVERVTGTGDKKRLWKATVCASAAFISVEIALHVVPQWYTANQGNATDSGLRLFDFFASPLGGMVLIAFGFIVPIVSSGAALVYCTLWWRQGGTRVVESDLLDAAMPQQSGLDAYRDDCMARLNMPNQSIDYYNAVFREYVRVLCEEHHGKRLKESALLQSVARISATQACKRDNCMLIIWTS